MATSSENVSTPTAQELLTQARQKGYLTSDDILTVFPDPELNLDALEELYAQLQEEGINIYQSEIEAIAAEAKAEAEARSLLEEQVPAQPVIDEPDYEP